MNLIEIQTILQTKMDKRRYQHTLGVMYTAGALAMSYGMSVEQAMLAGLLHDCVKCVPKHTMKSMCTEYGVELSKIEQENFALVHAKLGAIVAQVEYGVDDPEILDAIRYHTTGRPEMTMLDKIVYMADYVEPYRDLANLDELRWLAFNNIDMALYECCKTTLWHLNNRKIPVDPMTQETYEFYKTKENK